MNNMWRALLLSALALGLVASIAATPAAAVRDFALELGYTSTSEPVYGSGLVYGFSIMEGSGRFGLGITYMRLGNSDYWERPIKVGGDVIVYKYKEERRDSYLSILGTWMRGKSPETHLIAGVGPQIHFLAVTKSYLVEGYTQDARDSRLGIGAMVRYQHRIEMFGSMSVMAAASFSWMESGVELPDVYSPPAEGMTSAALTVGLAFPF